MVFLAHPHLRPVRFFLHAVNHGAAKCIKSMSMDTMELILSISLVYSYLEVAGASLICVFYKSLSATPTVAQRIHDRKGPASRRVPRGPMSCSRSPSQRRL